MERRKPPSRGAPELELAVDRGTRGKVQSEAFGGVEIADIDGPWGRAVRLANRQRGVFSRWQLLLLGFSADAIDRLIKRGYLHPLHRGFYAVGHEALAPLANEQAALLASGKGAVISDRSAASIWTPEVVEPPDVVEVTVTGRYARSRPGIRVRMTASLHPHDLRNLDGLPVTAPGRTVLDLAAIGFDRIEAVYSEMLARRLLQERDLVAALERAPRRRGAAEVRALLDVERRGFTRSEAERIMRKLCRQAQLQEPVSNVRVAGFEVDFFWPAENLIVEVDGYRYHSHRAAFERDRQRDARLLAAGFVVIRITWRQLTEKPLTVVATIASALSRSQGSPGS
jgi:very-short-patch-repair endonuclease